MPLGGANTALDRVEGHFGKELSELTVRECAMLAGLPQAPYRYDPRKNMYQRDKMEVTDERTNQVPLAHVSGGLPSRGTV